MLRESQTIGRLDTISNGGIFPPPGAISCTKFKRVARALWPRKTAEHLAARTRTSVRTAKYRLAGAHDITAKDIAAIVNELVY